MSRVWVPGDVAMVTGPAHLVDRDGDLVEMVAIRSSDCWYVARARGWTDREVTAVRPLVVIDPEDREQVERLDEAYQRALDDSPKYEGLYNVMQAALRSLTADPKPDEPLALGAVVEDVDGLRWIRIQTTNAAPFIREDAGAGEHSRPYRYYADIAATAILSEGVTP